MNEDFQDILSLLLEQEVEFVVVGAHALAIHGAARATGDIDVYVDDLQVPFLGRTAFLKNKAAAGRAKDLADIALLHEADGTG